MLLALALLAAPLPALTDGRAGIDPRSHELLKLLCDSRLVGSELTFFANGTLRLRQRGAEGTYMYLAELDRREVTDFVSRLEAEGSPGEQGIRRGVSGEWVEQCVLTLELEHNSPHRLRFSRVDTLPLHVSRLIAIADELHALAVERRVGAGFPAGYEARVGDVVRRADGSEFAIRRFTADGRGAELEGVRQPVILYLDREQIAAEFASLVRRRP